MLGSVSADVAVAAPDGTGAWAPDVAAPGSAGRPAGASAAHAGKAGLRRLKEDMLVMVLACVSVTSWFVTNNYRTNRYRQVCRILFLKTLPFRNFNSYTK